MAFLKELIAGIEIEKLIGNTDVEITGLAIDSREVKPGYLFIAQRGTVTDGHGYIRSAIESGAVAVIAEDPPVPVFEAGIVLVKNSRVAAGYIASAFYGHPSERLALVGITGTNGKTTVATLCYRMMRAMGCKVGLLSTVEVLIGEKKVEATHTTPDVLQLNRHLKTMVDTGISQAFMEVSSHALDQDRVAGIQFRGGVFTNITHEHLDYHGDFRSYIRAKKKLFDQLPETAFALVNADDRNASIMVQNCKSDVFRFALKTVVPFKGKILENSIYGLKMMINEREVDFRLPGEFNALNLLAAFAVGVLLGFEENQVLTALSGIKGPEGRFELEWGPSRKITGIVDYAHTPDALQKILETLGKMDLKGGRIITVIGCGGDRDRTKRPKMAEVASRLSDQCVFTSDNPRSEEPEMILEEMMRGVPVDKRENVWKQVDRREGIRLACKLASPGDIVLVAGKGHEKYQEINGKKFPFDDKKVLGEYLS